MKIILEIEGDSVTDLILATGKLLNSLKNAKIKRIGENNNFKGNFKGGCYSAKVNSIKGKGLQGLFNTRDTNKSIRNDLIRLGGYGIKTK